MNKIYNGIMGLVVGDALGVPFEFKKRDSFTATDMRGHGTYNQPPGTWSDDSSMTLATVESIGRLGRIDPADIMENFFRWLNNADFTPWGKVFDVGAATQRAITRYANGKPLEDCGGKSVMDNGNGALMRILPLAFTDCRPESICRVTGMTHNTAICKAASLIYIAIALQLIAGKDKGKAVFAGLDCAKAVCNMPEEFARIPDIEALTRDEIRSTGYVVDTLEAALWCVLKTDSYRDCVLTAVNLGEDTDTVAAVAGGLAGIIYGCGGESGIPDEWIAQIPRRDWIKALCAELILSQDKGR